MGIMADIVDLSEAIEVCCMSVCPFCCQPLEEYEAIATFKAHGGIGLAHVECIAEKREELGI